MVNTRNTRSHQTTRDPPNRRKTTPPGAINARKIKRRRADNPSTNTNPSQQPTTSDSQPDQRTTTEAGLDRADLTVHNYGSQKKHWPMPRILDQLSRQRSKNHSQPNPLIVAEAIAIHNAFEHSLHMLAMIGNVSLDTLKAPLGMKGLSRPINNYQRFLSFSNLAYALPMPQRGAPDASEVLAARNRANKAAYDKLTDDQYAVFTPRVFYALGGYPDYSAIEVDEAMDTEDCEVLIPEVPKLSPDEEELYRPLYEKIVNETKVGKDRVRFQAPSAKTKEKRSLQVFKKIMQQLNYNASQAEFDYYVIACSKTLGTGWCEEVTSRPEISGWLAQKCKFQNIFSIYSQAGDEINEINSNSAANNDSGIAKSARRPNKSDKESTELTDCLRKQLIGVLGLGHPSLPVRGFPRGPNLPALFQKLNIPVKIIRDLDLSAMTKDEFELGFDQMKTAGRRHWLEDIKAGKFTMVLKDKDVNDDDEVRGGGGEAAGGSAVGGSGVVGGGGEAGGDGAGGDSAGGEGVGGDAAGGEGVGGDAAGGDGAGGDGCGVI